jgi:hypothetical protein
MNRHEEPLLQLLCFIWRHARTPAWWNRLKRYQKLLLVLLCIIGVILIPAWWDLLNRVKPGPDAVGLCDHEWFEGNLKPEQAERLIRLLMSVDKGPAILAVSTSGECIVRRLPVRDTFATWAHGHILLQSYLDNRPLDEQEHRAYTVRWLSSVLSTYFKVRLQDRARRLR